MLEKGLSTDLGGNTTYGEDKALNLSLLKSKVTGDLGNFIKKIIITVDIQIRMQYTLFIEQAKYTEFLMLCVA